MTTRNKIRTFDRASILLYYVEKDRQTDTHMHTHTRYTIYCTSSMPNRILLALLKCTAEEVNINNYHKDMLSSAPSYAHCCTDFSPQQVPANFVILPRTLPTFTFTPRKQTITFNLLQEILTAVKVRLIDNKFSDGKNLNFSVSVNVQWQSTAYQHRVQMNQFHRRLVGQQRVEMTEVQRCH